MTMNRRPFQKQWAILLALVFTGAAWMRAQAATTNITYGYYYFSNSVVQINVGDTVVWTNGSGTHTVQGTGADPICGGAYLPCAHTFNTPGTYPYECTQPYHASYGMVGTIVVVRPSVPPAVVTNVMRLTNGWFQFTVMTTANQTNVIQVSTNLAGTGHWVALRTNVPASGSFTFTDTNTAGVGLRFYRVVEPE